MISLQEIIGERKLNHVMLGVNPIMLKLDKKARGRKKQICMLEDSFDQCNKILETTKLF
jgi:hypothetical protein